MAKTINKLDVRKFALETIYLELLRFLIINPDKMQAVQIQYDVTLPISNPRNPYSDIKNPFALCNS